MGEKIVYDRGQIKLGLENMNLLMGLLGHPENSIPAVQIAGTNGKGSTGCMIGKILESAGFKVGYYQTPAVSDPMEIIKIGDDNISQQDFDLIKTKISEKLADTDLSPTKFEMDTAVAFCYFAQKTCDVSIIEVGLGGDTDATNIVTNTIASVITPIGMDHMEYLGNTIEEIASHKAGIIKSAPTIVAEQGQEAVEVLRSFAAERGSSFTEAKALSMGEYRLSLKGSFQLINAGTAVETIKVLSSSWEPLKVLEKKEIDKAIKKGLASVVLFGRFTVYKDQIELVIDGAHNEPAARRLAQALEAEYADRPRIYVTGAFKDKEYMKTIGLVVKAPRLVITLKAPGSRGLESEKLAEKIEKLGYPVKAMGTVQEAINLACDEAVRIKEEKPVIIAFGSLSWLKEAEESYEIWTKDNR